MADAAAAELPANTVQALGETIAQIIMAQNAATAAPATTNGPGTAVAVAGPTVTVTPMVGGGIGGFDSFSLAITYNHNVYQLTVTPPQSTGDGWSFSLTDTTPGNLPTTLASFSFVSSQQWNVDVGIPPINNLFGTGVSIKQVSIEFGAGPSVTYSPASVALGKAITASGTGFTATATTVTANLVDSTSTAHAIGTATLTAGAFTNQPFTVTSSLAAGTYTLKMTDGTLTATAGPVTVTAS